MDGPAADQAPKAISGDVGSSKDAYDTRCSNRFCEINPIDLGMSMWAAQKIGMGLTWTVQVIGISSGTCDEPFVFLTADSLSYS